MLIADDEANLRRLVVATLGAGDYLTKPFSPLQLLKAVEQALDLR